MIPWTKDSASSEVRYTMFSTIKCYFPKANITYVLFELQISYFSSDILTGNSKNSCASNLIRRSVLPICPESILIFFIGHNPIHYTTRLSRSVEKHVLHV